jgi:hypothetical protein
VVDRWHHDQVRHEFRPVFGRALCVVVGAICAASLVMLLVQDPVDALRAAPWLLLVAGACWALFWRPCIVVDDGGVRLVNVLRTIDLPWPSIFVVDTKWALTLVTAFGRFTGWAAPAPGLRQILLAGREETAHLPSSTASADGIRPGDLPSSPSGGAALLIRRRWEALREAGHLENPRLEHESAPITWHVGTIVAGLALVALALVALVA